MNKTRIVVGISVLSMAVTMYSLGYSKVIGEVGGGTVTVYPAAALFVIGGLTLWNEIRRLLAV